MENYRQTDPRWAGLPIGGSIYKMGPYGCLTTAHATAFSIQGWNITPGDLCIHAELYITGEWLWDKVASVYPQYHYRSDKNGAFQFLQVHAVWSGKTFEHWLVVHNGVVYDPLDGTVGLKSNYTYTGYGHSADIDTAPAEPTIVTIAAVENPPEPQTFTVAVTIPILNVRTQPNLIAAIRQDKTLHKGDDVECVQAVMGDSVAGNNVWLHTKVSGLYIWSGGTDYHQSNLTI